MRLHGTGDGITVAKCSFLGRIGVLSAGFLIIVEHILVGSVSKEVHPDRGGQFIESFICAGDSGEFVIINNMVLWGDSTRLKVETEAYSGGMGGTDANVDSAGRPGLPSGDGLAILDVFV